MDTQIEKDLFGNIVPKVHDAATEELLNYDSSSFGDRLQRLKYVNNVFPFGTREYGSDESFRIFHEAINSFISGQFIGTIILAQAFIERRFQEYFHIRMDEEKAKFTLDKLLKEFAVSGFVDQYLVERINKIRLKRNPFVHHKEPLHKDSLMFRALQSNSVPDELLENDAKDALSLMLAICRLRIL